MKKILILCCLASVSIITSCEEESNVVKTITVSNTLEVPRSFETIEISKKSLNLATTINFENLVIRNTDTKEVITSQFIDQDADGNVDMLLFQPELKASSNKKYELVIAENLVKDTVAYCYSRFVPERTDDYAWENNKVAFRTYGPVAQQMVEDSVAGGTLSSGIDAWLKKVDYPIINKWYAKNDKNPGAYHKDTGEGLDNFHVGVSRGVGGTAVKNDTTYYVSKNFTHWKTITNGPIRTGFILEYAVWDVAGKEVKERKHISLDYGTNFSRFEVNVTGVDTLSVGLTLHDKKGEVTQNVNEGWVSYWEPHDGSELGTAIVVPNDAMIASDHFETSLVDQSNLFATLKVDQQKVVYYAGFAWKESKQYPTKTSWEHYTQDFTTKVNNPLEVTIE